jgi:glutamyl-tRNA synthetase
LPVSNYKEHVKQIFLNKGFKISDDVYFEKVLEMVKDRCTFLNDFWDHSFFFFKAPIEYDTAPIAAKWNSDKSNFFELFTKALPGADDWNASTLETLFKQLAETACIKPGELQLPLRIILVGGKFGPPVFNIAEVLGKEETVTRMENALTQFAKNLK